ncbi:MAG: IS982 family transposase [Ignavibacteria bacterium]|nr:IS982 family transposase [Ignavibacteria bacterium]
MDLTQLYCSVDDFWKSFKQEWDKHLIDSGKTKRGPEPKLSTSEMMTIVILFHGSNYRTFKHFYAYVCKYLRKDFPNLISYSHFVYLMKNLFIPLFAYLLQRRGEITGIAFIDSTSIDVCHNKRIQRNKVFKGLAKRGKTTAGWFYGFKLHLIINEEGELLAFQLTPGNMADVSIAKTLSKGIFGKLFGDKAYISAELTKKLLEQDLELFTALRSNMKRRLMKLTDKVLLRKRAVIETVNDQLKNISQIEHTRHRSAANFLINLLAGMSAYTHQPKKPSINLVPEDRLLLMAA